MDEIRYVHAADLHLDTPFSGLSKNFAPWAERLRNATFAAFDNLTQLCLTVKPDFVVLAGDIYNQEECSIKAQLKLHDMCVALARLDVPVCIVHGNHDPATSRFTAIQWPANTFIFGPEPQKLKIRKKGELIALVHGASHASDHENRNLAQLMRRDNSANCFQLGLLHCNVAGVANDDRYAPCSLTDLKNSALDAWALGHAHIRQILCEQPFIAYSGNIQGQYGNETGPKGCLVVTAAKDKSGIWQCQSSFRRLGPIQWQKLEIDLENTISMDEVEKRITDAMLDVADKDAEAIIVDLKVAGRTALAAELARTEVWEELETRLQPMSNGPTEILLRKTEVATAPMVSEAENMERDDLLGEISRLARDLDADPTGLAAAVAEAVAPVSRACRSLLPEADNATNSALLARARRICQDMLEKR